MGTPTKTAENKKPAEQRTRVSLQTDSSDPHQRGPLHFPGRIYCLTGLLIGGLGVAVAMCTVLVYRHRLETLQGRVDALEHRYSDVETTLRSYLDERLRTALRQQGLVAEPPHPLYLRRQKRDTSKHECSCPGIYLL